MEQLGNCFVENQQLVTSGDTYDRIYETLFESAVRAAMRL